MIRIGWHRNDLGRFLELPSTVIGLSKPDDSPERLYAQCADGSVWRVRRVWWTPVFWAYRVMGGAR